MTGTGMHIVELFKALLSEDSGATAIEYGLIIALIALAIMTSLESFADGSTGMWGRVEDKVTVAIEAPSP